MLERYVLRPALLEAFGWTVFEVLAKDWLEFPDEVLGKIDRLMAGTGDVLELEDGYVEGEGTGHGPGSREG